ncbi:hypothetical protein [Trichormus azollae]|uniref:Peptidase domain protein n=1 Tax=Nostoc azollae (strain 0708) TaxID=551115 RepID=D7E2T5_NOSA0|nr:hypothetical protein [Trichormus azollae]ADI63462.1 conserved hypothetical protein ['Nostoc azollae' 0708]
MRESHFWLQFCQASWLLASIITIMATPVLAQKANFGTLKLSPGFEAQKGIVTGFTGGSYSFSAMSNRDRDQKVCIGFGDPNPDHILVLEKDFDNLKILINSGGKDTTIFIKGPDDGTIRCGDDIGKSKEASVSDRNWKKGIYQLWVGTFNPGVQDNYTLTIEQ